MGVGGQRYSPPALHPGKTFSTACTGGRVGLRAGVDRYGKPCPHQDSIPGPSSPYLVAIPTTLARPLCFRELSLQGKHSCVLRIWEVPGSNIDRNVGYNDCLSLWFFWGLTCKYRDTIYYLIQQTAPSIINNQSLLLIFDGAIVQLTALYTTVCADWNKPYLLLGFVLFY
jgi:hypothetical protein